MPHQKKATPATAALRRSARLRSRSGNSNTTSNDVLPPTVDQTLSAAEPHPVPLPTTTQLVPDPSALQTESPDITRAKVPQQSSTANIPASTPYQEVASREQRNNASPPPEARKRHVSTSPPSSELGSKKPRVDFDFAHSEGSSRLPAPSDLLSSPPLASPGMIHPQPPTPLKPILKRRRVESSPGSPRPHENPEPPSYIVGIYDRLFSQRDDNGRVLRADYKRDLRGGAREWGKKPQTIMYLASWGPRSLVGNLHAKFFYRDDFLAHARMGVGNEDEEEDDEDSSEQDDEE
ncbi:hypothetical protein RUND412_003179 [Rhizina undulata]